MNCYFCKQPCQRDQRFATDSGEIWTCKKHPHESIHYINYIYHKKDGCEGPSCCPHKEHSSTEVYWVKNKKRFVAEWLHPEGAFVVSQINWGIIFQLPQIPLNITPENIEEKIGLWITFS